MKRQHQCKAVIIFLTAGLRITETTDAPIPVNIPSTATCSQPDAVFSTTDATTPKSNGSATTKSNTKLNRVEIEGFMIGDEHRSTTSSANFFSSIDRDGDGTLGRPELSHFLKFEIGGDELDTNEEVQPVVESILSILDLNAEYGLDEGDMNVYWKKNLDGLLGLDDVAEWLEHAVQVPFDEVGRKFCEHHVTGYDFPELVESGGQRLENEIGISNPMIRKKIVKHFKLRMLGVESTLPKVVFDPHVVSCNRVTLAWKAVESSSPFPVHKYRMQRMAVPLMGGSGTSVSRRSGEGDVVSRGGACDKGKNDSIGLVGNWETVYKGSEPKYVDVRMSANYEYTYRIEAWNAVGRSPWTSVDVSTKRKLWESYKCPKDPTNKHSNELVDGSPSSNKSPPAWGQMVLFLIGGFCSVAAWVVPMMIRLNSSYKDGAQCPPGFSCLRAFLNSVSQKFFKTDIMPDKFSNKKIDRDMPDGHAKARQRNESPTPDTSFYENSDTDSTVDSTLKSETEMRKRKWYKPDFLRKKNRMQNRSLSPSIISASDPYILRRKNKMQNRSLLPRATKSDSSVLRKRRITHTRPMSDLTTATTISGNFCAICTKKGKVYHLCSKCGVQFCRSCGMCTHPKWTPCHVLSKCICKQCKPKQTTDACVRVVKCDV